MAAFLLVGRFPSTDAAPTHTDHSRHFDGWVKLSQQSDGAPAASFELLWSSGRGASHLPPGQETLFAGINNVKPKQVSPGEVLGHYLVEEFLLEGGWSAVYRARDLRLERTVALKVLLEGLQGDDATWGRTLSEARLASSLTHPNICTIYDVGEEEGRAYVAMEYIEGRRLSDHIQHRGLPVSTVVSYGAQIARALTHAHDHGIIHGDIKSSNVMITEQGIAKLLDFGLAKRLAPEDLRVATSSRSSLAEIGPVAGTLAYLAPEVLRGRPTSARSDIWALGILLHEMTYGDPPFRGETPFELSTQIMTGQRETPPLEIPRALNAVIEGCTEKDPALRYQSAGEVLAVLEELDRASSAPPPEPRKHPLAWVARILTVFLILLLGFALVPKLRRILHSWSAISESPSNQQLAILSTMTATSDPELSAFCGGLIERLTARLSEVAENRSLHVIPATLIRERKVITLQQAREEFGVNLGLMVNLQRSGDTMRVAYELVDAKSGRQLRGGTVTAPSSDPFTLENKVTDGLIEALRLGLQPKQPGALEGRGTVRPAAYDFYLQGRGYLQDALEPDHVSSAIEVFKRALELDPEYAPAFAGLGEAYWHKFEITKDEDWIKRAQAACEKALALEKGQAEANTCLGLVSKGIGRFEQAVEYYQNAVRLEPTNDDAVRGLASAYARLGKTSQAEKTYWEAINLRPSYWRGYNLLGTFYVEEGRYAEAAEMFEQVVALAPDSFRGYSNLGGTYIYLGRYADAVAKLERSISIRPTAAAYSNLATAYFNLRKFGDAARLYEEALKLDDRDYVVWGNLGASYSYAEKPGSKIAEVYKKALSLAQERRRVNPGDAVTLAEIAGYQVKLKQDKAALHSIGIALHQAPTNPDVLFKAALVSNALGKGDDAIRMLRKALAMGYSPIVVRDSPELDNLRADPRFQAIPGISPRLE